MYRADDIAIAIYERARTWIRASFVLYRLEESRSEPVYFSNGVKMEGPVAGRHLLFCDEQPGTAWPHDAWAFVWTPAYSMQPPAIDGWLYVNGYVDTKRSKIVFTDDKTEEIQLQLNRLRMREELMKFGLGRQPWRVAPLFKPDHSEIAKQSGVPESTVRSFFDGKRVSREAEEKILLIVNMRPEEMGVKLWGR